MGSAALFSGNYVKFLKNQLNLFDAAHILTGTQDPRSVATSAPKGSILLRQGAAGQLFAKLDDGLSTNWKLLPLSATFEYSINPAAGFQLAFVDEFDVSTSDPDSLVELNTNATHDAVRGLYRLNCDKSLTVTTVGSAYTLSGAPGFTVQSGDIIYSGGAWRQVSIVNTTTTGLLDDVFPVDLSGAACMVSQAVWTKDLVNNIGNATQQTRPRDFFPGVDIQSISLDYFDSLVADDAVPDFIDAANIVASASARGLYTAIDTVSSSDFTSPVFTRPQAPSEIPDYPLSVVPGQERLFLVFFPNPDNANVTTGANLIRYRVSFYADDGIAEGGVLDSAFAMSDGSAAEVNCTAPTITGGVTRLTLGWSFIPNLNPGTTAGDLEVLVDGQVLPRYVAGATMDAYYQEVVGTTDTIDFWDDLSGTPISIEIRRRQGTVDTSDQNAVALAGLTTVLNLSSSSTVSRQTYLRIMANTSGGAFQITLPSSPEAGDRIEIQDPTGSWFTNNVTINPNGNAIMGVVGNDTLDVANGWVMYEWVGGSQGWLVRA